MPRAAWAGFCAPWAGSSLPGTGYGAVLGATVYAGFYADMEHREGNGPPAGALVLSGVSSILPLVAAVATRSLPTLAFAIAKPIIWFVAR